MTFQQIIEDAAVVYDSLATGGAKPVADKYLSTLVALLALIDAPAAPTAATTPEPTPPAA